ncbi:hypothetical protein [Streptomyces sp. NPDC007083]|uniref:hypothetical protein n=1 Tax=Streptomyces sp. NPDC007083 TaxID=3156913 RepID=UPI0033F1808E
MADAHREVTQQLRNEVGALTGALGALVGPDETIRALEHRIHELAPMWAAQLLQDDDDKLSAQTISGLMPVLWRDGESPTEW